MQLIALTLVPIVLYCMLTRRLVGCTFTVGVFYFIGWGFAILSAKIISEWGMAPAITEFGEQLLRDSHIGAIIGFCSATVLHAVFGQELGKRPPKLVQDRHAFAIREHAVYVMLLATAAVSLAYVVYRFAYGGASITDVSDIRASFLSSRLNWGQRLLSQAALIIAAIPAIFAVEDAQSGRIRVKRLATYFAINAVGGFTSGGRLWVVVPIAMYVFPYLCAIDGKGAVRGAVKMLWCFRMLVVVMFVLFSLMYFFRAKGSGSLDEKIADEKALPWYQRDLGVQPVLVYFGLPTCAMETYAEVVEAWSPTWGGMSLGWFSAQLYRVGVYPRNYSDEYEFDVRDYVRNNIDDRIGPTHATALPRFVSDFGIRGVLPAMAVVAFLCELVCYTQRNRGFVRHLVAATCLQFGGFWMMQDFMLLGAGVILPVFWAWFIVRVFSKQIFKKCE